MHGIITTNNNSIKLKKHLRWILIISIAMIVFITAIGGITRLTNSGLSMVKWGVISGIVPPVSTESWIIKFEEYQQHPEFKIHNPTMNLSEFKKIFLIEYIHRIIGRVTGIIFLYLLFFSIYNKRYFPTKFLWLSISLFILVVTQGIIGWYMVKSGLIDNPRVEPLRLAMHFSGAIIIFLTTSYFFLLNSNQKKIYLNSSHNNSYYYYIVFFISILVMQVLLGILVAGNKAGFIYNTYPLMEGSFIPYNMFDQYNTVYENILYNKKTVQWVHRTNAILLMTSAFVLYFITKRLFPNQRWVYQQILTINLLLVIQFFFGVFTLLLVTPMIIAVSHQLISFLVIYQVFLFVFRVRFNNNAIIV